MSIFRDTDHLYQVLGALFEQVAAEPAIVDRLLEGNLVVRFRFTEPYGSVTVDLRQAPLTFTFGQPDGSTEPVQELEPDVEMIQSGDTAHQFWLGRLNVARAIATALRASAALWMRPSACRQASSRLCTPIDSRFTPAAR